jgi:lysozyme family protein
MSNRAFDVALAFVLAREGGSELTEDPSDPGGTTRYGISQRAFPDVDIQNLTMAGATALYRSRYWDSCKCDELPAALALLVFDCAVNQGVSTAGKLLQRVLGLPEDGIIGPQTLLAAKNELQPGLLEQFQAARIIRYAQSNAWPTFGKGWVMRVLLGLKAASF